MSALVQLNKNAGAGTTLNLTKKEFDAYCRNCELNEKCNKKNKPFQLQSTIEAAKLHKKMKTEGYNMELGKKLPYKIFELKVVLEQTIDNFSYK